MLHYNIIKFSLITIKSTIGFKIAIRIRLMRHLTNIFIS